MERIEKVNYYLDIAESVLERSTCIRRNFGAVIVKNDEIISTGYNGAPRGRKNCSDLKYCMREKLNIHGEQNAIISAKRSDMIDADIYLVGKNFNDGSYVSDARPCAMCKRVIINAGIKNIYVRNDKENYTKIEVQEYIDNDETLEGTLGY